MTPFRRRQIVVGVIAAAVGTLLLVPSGRAVVRFFRDFEDYESFLIIPVLAFLAFVVAAALAQANRGHLPALAYRLLSVPVWVVGSAYLLFYCLSWVKMIDSFGRP